METIHHAQGKPHNDQNDPGNARNAESRDGKYLHGNEDDPDDENDNFPVGGKPFDVKRRKIEQCRNYGSRKREAHAGRLQFEIKATDDDHNEDARNDGTDKESDDAVSSRDLLFYHSVMFQSGRFQNSGQAFGCSLAKMIFYGFGSGKGDHTPRIGHTGNVYARVNHSFSNPRVTTFGFGCAAHHRPHVRLVFVGKCFAGLVDNRGGTDAGTRTHVDAVAGDGNQGSGRCCIVVDKNPDGNTGFENNRADGIGGIQQSPVSIHVYQYQIGRRIPGLPEGFLCFVQHRRGDFFFNVESKNFIGFCAVGKRCCGFSCPCLQGGYSHKEH